MPVPELAAIAALTAAITDGFKTVAGLVDTMKDAKTKEAVRAAVTDLKEKVMDQREIILGLREENIALKEEVGALKSAGETKARLKFDGTVYWQEPEPGGSGNREGPFCPTCWDTNERVIRLQHFGGMEGDENGWRCNTCGHAFFPE